VRRRAGVLGAMATAVLALLPVAAFAQLPSVDEVVGGVPDPSGVVGQQPALPSLPANPLPAQPPAVNVPTVEAPTVQAPAVQSPAVQAPAVQAPAQAPSAPEPAGSLLQQHSSPSAGSGGGPSSGAGAGDSGTASSDTGPGARATGAGGAGRAGRAGRHARSDAGGTRKSGRAERGGAELRAIANAAGSGAASAFGAELALAESAADPLPEDPRPTSSPFSGFALGLLVFTGLCALGIGLAVRQGAGRVGLRRAIS
jgi:hypothetical protein